MDEQKPRSRADDQWCGGGDEVQLTPHEYALARGWSYEHIEATARLGAAEEDQQVLGAAEVAALVAWCVDRVEAEGER